MPNNISGSYVTTSDGAQIYFKDWGSGQPILFSHGWPLTADDWEMQMVFMTANGYRAVAKAVLVGAVPPLMLKTEANPGGLPIDVFDGIRAGAAADRSQFFMDLTLPFYGGNRPGSKLTQGTREAFRLRGMQGGLKNELDCIKAFSETDFTEDLKKFDEPTLIIHGDDDQIVPIDAAGRMSAKLVKGSTLKVYPGGCHGLVAMNTDELNADLLAFIKG